jgi:hypothetical protein
VHRSSCHNGYDVVKLAFGSFVIALVVATPASAYVRTTTVHRDPAVVSVPVQWNVRCLGITPDSRGSRDLLLTDVEATLARAITNWNNRTSTCGGLVLSANAAARALDVGDDGFNALVFRNDVFQRPGHDPYPTNIIALTTVVYVDTPGRAGDGTLLDADIEVNNANFTFSTQSGTGLARTGTQLVNLENTLTHELGHVQGLAHTCWDGTTTTDPIDNQGNPIPDCTTAILPDGVTNSIMYPFYEPDAPDRPLTDDDVRGVCDVYGSLPQLACWHDVTGGCNTTPVAPTPATERRRRGWPLLPAASLAAAMALAWARARRRSRRWP